MARTTANTLLIAMLGVLIAFLLRGHLAHLFNGYYWGVDSYELMARVKASVAAGRLVYLVPGDNSGQHIPLFWSHLLGGWIIATAAPLALFLGWSRALYFAGAMVGPESLAAIGVAALFAARSLGGGKRLQLLPGIFMLSAPSIIAYSMFARPNHRILVVCGVVSVATLVVRSITDDPLFQHAALAGALSALGVWLSPEFVPFALLGWAALLLGDAAQSGRVAGRGIWFPSTFTIGLLVIVAVDPPYGGYFASVLDRISIAYVELGALMAVTAAIATRMPAIKHPWGAAFAVAIPAIVAVAIWTALHPIVLGGVTSVMGSQGASQFLAQVPEMRSVIGLQEFVLFVAVPALSLLTGVIILLCRRKDPIAVFAFALLLGLIVFAVSHLRFTDYIEAFGAIVAAVLLERLLPKANVGGTVARLLGIAVLALLVLVSPLLGGVLLASPAAVQPTRGCNARLAVTALNATAPHIVLAPLSDAPAILYFSHATVVASPYTSRTGDLIAAAQNAFSEQNFGGTKIPRSVRKTGASYILVCTYGRAARQTLSWALANGHPPLWAVRQPISPASGYRLFRIVPDGQTSSQRGEHAAYSPK